VPFSSFRPVQPDHPVLDPFLVHTLTIRFEPRRQVISNNLLFPILILKFGFCFWILHLSCLCLSDINNIFVISIHNNLPSFHLQVWIMSERQKGPRENAENLYLSEKS
jgi:hypothetical protein